MITVLRKQFKSSFKYILWIIVGAFVVGMMPLLFRQATSPTSIWAIRINGQEVGYRDFMYEVDRQQRYIMNVRAQYGEYADWLLSAMGAQNPKSNAFKSLVRQELINQFADRLGIFLNPDYVVQKLNDPQFVTQELSNIVPPQLIDETGGINEGMLRQYLKHTGLTVDAFERMIERELIDKLAFDVLASGFYLPEFDIKQKMVNDLSKKSFSILKLNKNAFVEQEKKKLILDEDLKKYFDEQNARLKRYWVPEKRSGKMWTFDVKSYGITIPDDQIKQFYEQNKTKLYIDQPATVQVRRILFKVPNEALRAKIQVKAARTKDDIMQDPSQFAVIAKERSEDESSAKKGGLLESFAKGKHDATFDRAAFILQEDGAVSDVIETAEGYEILQRVSKKTQTIKPFDAVKKDIKEDLINKQFGKQFSRDMRNLLETGDEKALQDFIKEHNGCFKEIKDMENDNSLVAQHLFKIAPKTTTFFVDGEVGHVIQLNSITEQNLPDLEAIKPIVRADFDQEKAQEALKAKLKEAKTALETQSFKDLQKSLNAEFIQTGWLSNDTKEANEALSKKGVPVPQMLQLEKSGSAMVHTTPNEGYLIRLDEIMDPEEATISDKKEAILEELKTERMRQYMDGFVASLYRNATIETNESVITLQD